METSAEGETNKGIMEEWLREADWEREEERWKQMSRAEWGDWMHAEREVSIELLYARLGCGCHGHLAVGRRASRWVSWCLLRELSNDVVTGCNRGDSSGIRHVSKVGLRLSAGKPAAKSTGAPTVPSVTPLWDIFTFDWASAPPEPQSNSTGWWCFFCVKYLCHALVSSYSLMRSISYIQL